MKEEGQTTAYYLVRTWQTATKINVQPGEHILSFMVSGVWNGFAKPYHYYCKMTVDDRYKVSLSDVTAGEYVQETTKK